MRCFMAMSQERMPGLTLVVGGEDLLVERAVARVVTAARERDPETEVRTIDAAEPGAAGLVAEACSPTLFGGGSVVVVERLESGDESVAKAVVGASRGILDTVDLVAVHAGAARGKKMLEIVAAAAHARVDCPQIKRGRPMAEFVRSEFRTHKRTAAKDAEGLLIAVCGSDARLVAAACAQLAADVTERVITADNVRTYFGSSAEVTGFQIADAVLARRLSEAVRLSRGSEVAEGGNVGPATVAAVAGAMRQVVRYASASPGMSERDLAAHVGAPTWRLRALADYARKWKSVEIAAAFLVLAESDAALKGGLRRGEQLDAAQKSLALEQMINRLVARRR